MPPAPLKKVTQPKLVVTGLFHTTDTVNVSFMEGCLQQLAQDRWQKWFTTALSCTSLPPVFTPIGTTQTLFTASGSVRPKSLKGQKYISGHPGRTCHKVTAALNGKPFQMVGGVFGGEAIVLINMVRCEHLGNGSPAHLMDSHDWDWKLWPYWNEDHTSWKNACVFEIHLQKNKGHLNKTRL